MGKKREKRETKKDKRLKLQAEMTIPFMGISNIIQGINQRSKDIQNKKLQDRKFDDLYNLLSNEFLLIQAYGNIRANKGSMTPGVNSETIDEISLNKIREIATKIKNHTFKFSRLRRKWILKAKLYKKGEKKRIRPLSVPTFSDRLVQEAIRIILEAIYEPIFENTNANAGFRPGKGCHHSITYLKENGTNCTLAVEGDIDGAYDNVNHETLIKILEKRISDRKFLDFLNQGFKCGILDNWQPVDTLTGVPQGGLASPILFNIYMYEFDLFIKKELQQEIDQINKNENRNKKPRNREYDLIASRIQTKRLKLQRIKRNRKFMELNNEEKQLVQNLQKEMKEMSKIRFKTPSLLASKREIKIVYSRYADDFVILTNGKKKVVELIKEKISKFLKENLQLSLSLSKTKITNLKVSGAKFLGFSLKTYIKRRLTLSKYGEQTKRAGWDLIIGIDTQRVMDRLQMKKFINFKHKPIAKNPWAVLREEEIVNRYNYILRGIANYYFPIVDRLTDLNYIMYLLKFSCLGTFAKKFNSKITKITQKYGDPLTINIKETQTIKKGNNTKEIETEKKFTLLTYAKLKDLIKPKKVGWKKINIKTPNDDVFKPMITINWRTLRNLTNICCICGTPEKVQMHHIRHVHKGKVIGFSQVMKQLNRTMIPVCETHHREIHQGKYDNLKLSELFGIERFIL